LKKTIHRLSWEKRW